MLVHIIKNIIVLSNTSTNVSSEAIKLLLSEITLDHSSGSTTTTTLTNNLLSNSASSRNSNNTNNNFGFKAILDETDFHLYHPLYLNNQLNQYSKSGGGGNPTSTTVDNQHSTENNNHSK
jgi:hypothetical protein